MRGQRSSAGWGSQLDVADLRSAEESLETFGD
jgi:hypothetical protein